MSILLSSPDLSSWTVFLTPSKKASTASPAPSGIPPFRMYPPFSTLISSASLTVGSPPSRKATVKLPRLWCSCGERRTRLRMSFFWSVLKAWITACAVSELGSTSESSSISCARRRSVGGKWESNASMKVEFAASMTGIVVDDGSRSGNVVNGLPCCWVLPERLPLFNELRKFCTIAAASVAPAKALKTS